MQTLSFLCLAEVIVGIVCAQLASKQALDIQTVSVCPSRRGQRSADCLQTPLSLLLQEHGLRYAEGERDIDCNSYKIAKKRSIWQNWLANY